MTVGAYKARKEYFAQYRRNNREKVNEYQRQWRKDNPDKVKLYNERFWEKYFNERSDINS